MTKQLKLFISAAIFLGIGAAIWIALIYNQDNSYPIIVSSRPILGFTDAEISIIEYSDFGCPASKLAATEIKKIVRKYENKVKFEFRNFPLINIHPKSFQAALAAECANDQGKFWGYHDLLFLNQSNFSRSNLLVHAENLGLDMEIYKICFDEKIKADVVSGHLKEAREFKLNSTPTIFVNGKKLKNWSLLEQEIEDILK